MKIEDFVLQGRYVRLEPLELSHADGLVAASAVDPSLYQWSPIPQGNDETMKYIETAQAWNEADTAVPFAIIRTEDEMVIGSTRSGISSVGRGRRVIPCTEAVLLMPVRLVIAG